jgi:hypothetical protein
MKKSHQNGKIGQLGIQAVTQSEKRVWKFYPPSELVRMPLKIFSTF